MILSAEPPHFRQGTFSEGVEPLKTHFCSMIMQRLHRYSYLCIIIALRVARQSYYLRINCSITAQITKTIITQATIIRDSSFPIRITMDITEMTTIPAITDAGAITQGISVANFAIDCISNISC
jgi:hypothetical protein